MASTSPRYRLGSEMLKKLPEVRELANGNLSPFPLSVTAARPHCLGKLGRPLCKRSFSEPVRQLAPRWALPHGAPKGPGWQEAARGSGMALPVGIASNTPCTPALPSVEPPFFPDFPPSSVSCALPVGGGCFLCDLRLSSAPLSHPPAPHL